MAPYSHQIVTIAPSSWVALTAVNKENLFVTIMTPLSRHNVSI
jgi:hypothetical protein